jgi:hypothetical protein
LKRGKAEGERLRIIRRLALRGTRLRRDESGVWRFESDGRPASRDCLASGIVESLSAEGLVIAKGDTITLSDLGKAALRRSLAGVEGYRAQHQDLAAAAIVDADGHLRQVTIDRGESPLSWLRHRRGRDGRPMIDAVEFTAGERLRADFERGRIMPRVTANWSAAVADHRRDGGAGGIADLTEAAIAARRRVERALESVGPELGGLLVDFCCFLKGLEEIERERRWPVHSAKLVLRLGLAALARHYGLAPKARGRPYASAIVHWGTADYRPAIE